MVTPFIKPPGSVSLEALAVGPYSLGVPVLDGCIQIDARGDTEDTRLSLVKHAYGEINVSREDDEPLQIELVEGIDGDDATFKATRVLANPVSDITFTRTITESDTVLWLPKHQDIVAYERGMTRFVEELGFYALHHQTADAVRSRHST